MNELIWIGAGSLLEEIFIAGMLSSKVLVEIRRALVSAPPASGCAFSFFPLQNTPGALAANHSPFGAIERRPYSCINGFRSKNSTSSIHVIMVLSASLSLSSTFSSSVLF